MAHAETATGPLVRRNTQRDGFTYAAGFSITLFRASFFIACTGKPQSSNSQRVYAPPRRSRQSKTRDMPAKPFEVIPTVIESVPFDITYEDLSSTTRGLQDRARQQYHAKQTDQASLRRVEAATQAERDRAAALDRHSLRVLEASNSRARDVRPSDLQDRSSRQCKQSTRSTRAAIPSSGSSEGDPETTEHSGSPLQRAQGLQPVASQIIQTNASIPHAAGQTTALRLPALSTVISSADSFVRVESSPSNASSSLFHLPTRPVYQRALETTPSPSAISVRPNLFQRTLTAFPEIGKLVGATVPPPATARPFTRIDSGAYSSDNPASSDRPLRLVVESTSPSWSSEDEAEAIVIIRAAEVQERHNETPSKTSVQQSRISSWTSEEKALAATRNDIVHTDKNSERSPSRSGEEEMVASAPVKSFPVEETSSRVPTHVSIRQPGSPSWSNMEEAFGTAEDDFVHVEKRDEAYSATSSHSPKQSAHVLASVESNLDFAEQQSDQISPPEIGEADATGSVEDDFDPIENGEECGTFELPPQGVLSSPVKDNDWTIPPAAKTQKWLEDQLADPMRSSAPATPVKIRDEYADLFSPTLGAQASWDSRSLYGKSVDDDLYLVGDGEAEQFEDWENIA